MTAGQSYKFTAHVLGALNSVVLWSARLGNIRQDGGYTAPESSADAIDTVTAASQADPATKAELRLKIRKHPAPVVAFFTTTKGSILPGQTAQLQWKTTNSHTVEIAPTLGMVAPEGFDDVAPSQTTNYQLVAKSPGGTAAASLTVVVCRPMVIHALDPVSKAERFGPPGGPFKVSSSEKVQFVVVGGCD